MPTTDAILVDNFRAIFVTETMTDLSDELEPRQTRALEKFK